MNELRLYRFTDRRAEQGYKTIFIGPDHPGYAGFHPIAGMGLGYNDLKIIEARDVVAKVAGAEPFGVIPDFAFGHKISRAIDAVERSVAEHRWVRVDEIG